MTPPVNMSNSIYLEFKKNLKLSHEIVIKRLINKINCKMRTFAKGYKAEFLGLLNKKTIKIKLEIVGDGDYLPKFAGNLDIITNMATNVLTNK